MSPLDLTIGAGDRQSGWPDKDKAEFARSTDKTGRQSTSGFGAAYAIPLGHDPNPTALMATAAVSLSCR
jgi:hypothetical protein